MGMAAILINGPWPFVQIFNHPLTEGSTWSLKKICTGVSEKLFKGVYRRMMDERTTDGKWSQQLILSPWFRWAKKGRTIHINFSYKPHPLVLGFQTGEEVRKILSKIIADGILNVFIFSYIKTWHFMWIICPADDSHEKFSHIFSEKSKHKISKCNLLQLWLALGLTQTFICPIQGLLLVLLNLDMSCLCKQWRSRSGGFWRSQLIWICTVCH